MATGTLFSQSLSLDSDGWDGYTGVERISASAMSLPSGSIIKLRIKFQAASGEGFSITNAYIGHRAGSGDPYDFSATPVQLLFGGSANVDISASSEQWSDWASFSYNKTSNLLVSFYCGGGSSSDAPRYETGLTGISDYEKVANDAATVNKTGYSVNDGLLVMISAIEYETSEGGVGFLAYF